MDFRAYLFFDGTCREAFTRYEGSSAAISC